MFLKKSIIKIFKKQYSVLKLGNIFSLEPGLGRGGEEKMAYRGLENLPEKHNYTQYSSSVWTGHFQVEREPKLSSWISQLLRWMWVQLDCP